MKKYRVTLEPGDFFGINIEDIKNADGKCPYCGHESVFKNNLVIYDKKKLKKREPTGQLFSVCPSGVLHVNLNDCIIVEGKAHDFKDGDLVLVHDDPSRRPWKKEWVHTMGWLLYLGYALGFCIFMIILMILTIIYW